VTIPPSVIANFATPYVVSGWTIATVALAGYAIRIAVRTRRAQRGLDRSQEP